MNWKKFGYTVMPVILAALIAAVVGVIGIGLAVLLSAL